MKRKGWGPWAATWYSLCSRHRNHVVSCKLCNAGHWTYDWVYAVDHVIFVRFRPLWLWWHNRRNSKINRLLREHFPNLR